MITNLTIFAMLMQVASVEGQVHDAQTRKALALVRIELSHQGVPSALEYTDVGGRFHFANVTPGTYTIQWTAASQDGHAASGSYSSSFQQFRNPA